MRWAGTPACDPAVMPTAVIVAPLCSQLSMPHFLKFFIEIAITVSRDDAFQEVRRRDTRCAASRNEFTLTFHIRVHIILACACIWVFIMSDVIDLEFPYERLVDYPWSFWDNFVHPSAVFYCLNSLSMGHDALSLVCPDLLIRVDTNEKINRWKGQLGLAQLKSMTKMEEVINAVRIHSDWPTSGWWVDLVFSPELSVNGFLHERLDVLRSERSRPGFLWGRICRDWT